MPVVIFLFSFPCWHNKQDEKKTSKKSKAKNFELIDHNTITERHLNESKVHFSKRGTTILSNNFTEAIPGSIQWLFIIHSLNDKRSSGRFTCDKYTYVSALMKKKIRHFCWLIKSCQYRRSRDTNKKIEKYGICDKNLLWFKSYLSNRKQHIEYKDDFNKQKSTDLLQLECGVPQSSILGPLLFLIYTKNLSLVTKYLSSIIFAETPICFILPRV